MANLVHAPNLETPNTNAEKKAVECFIALKEAEGKFTEGQNFGRAIVELREEIKASGDRNFIARIEQLGISYEKARYWMNVAEGKPTHRGTTRVSNREGGWAEVARRFKKVVDEVDLLERNHKTSGGGQSVIECLGELADILGYRLVVKAEGAAA